MMQTKRLVIQVAEYAPDFGKHRLEELDFSRKMDLFPPGIAGEI